MDKVKLLLARTEDLWWDGLALRLLNRPDVTVVGVCSNAVETIDKAGELKPDVIILDEEIKAGDCGEVAQRINEIRPEANIIIIILPHETINVSSSFKAKAKAYLDKHVSFDEFINIIRYVAKGGVVAISPIIAEKLLENAAAMERNIPRLRPEYDIDLSRREIEVLTLLAKQGISNKEIAGSLYVTESTVKAHISSILEKMRVRSRHQAAELAKAKGIVSKEP